METWFRTIFEKIDQVDVVRYTEKTVTRHIVIMGRSEERRANRHGSYESYFPSWEEAHAFLIEKAERKLQSARQEVEDAPKRARAALSKAQGLVANIKGMKPPQGAN